MTEQKKPAGMANTVDVIARAQARRDALPKAGPGHYGPDDPLPDDAVIQYARGAGATDSDDQEDFRGRTALWEAYILAGGDPTIAGDPQRDVAGMHVGMLADAAVGAVRTMRMRLDELLNGAPATQTVNVDGLRAALVMGEGLDREAALQLILDSLTEQQQTTDAGEQAPPAAEGSQPAPKPKRVRPSRAKVK